MTDERRRNAYQLLSRHVARGYCTILFNPAGCLEWVEGNRPERPWDQLSEFFETAPLVLEVESLLAYLVEMLAEVQRVRPNIRLPAPPVLRPVGEIGSELSELLKRHPAWAAIWTGELPPAQPLAIAIRGWVARARHHATVRPDVMQERIEGWRDAMAENARRDSRRKLSKTDIDDWAVRANQLDAVLTAFDPALNVNEVLAEADFSRGQACSAYLNGMWYYIRERGSRPPDENDVDDWGQVPAMAYADYALTERRMRHYLVSGSPALEGVLFHQPQDLVRAMGLSE